MFRLELCCLVLMLVGSKSDSDFDQGGHGRRFQKFQPSEGRDRKDRHEDAG
jgi:hypothetical protein